MLVQELRHLHSILAVALHAHMQRAQPACEEEGLEGREWSSEDLLDLMREAINEDEGGNQRR